MPGRSGSVGRHVPGRIRHRRNQRAGRRLRPAVVRQPIHREPIVHLLPSLHALVHRIGDQHRAVEAAFVGHLERVSLAGIHVLVPLDRKQVHQRLPDKAVRHRIVARDQNHIAAALLHRFDQRLLTRHRQLQRTHVAKNHHVVLRPTFDVAGKLRPLGQAPRTVQPRRKRQLVEIHVLLTQEQLVKIPVLPVGHPMGQQHPRPIADHLKRDRHEVVRRVHLVRHRLDLDDIFLPAQLFGRHLESRPLVALRAGERDFFPIHLAPLVPQHNDRRLAVAIKRGDDHIDQSRVLLRDRRRRLDPMEQEVLHPRRATDRHQVDARPGQLRGHLLRRSHIGTVVPSVGEHQRQPRRAARTLGCQLLEHGGEICRRARSGGRISPCRRHVEILRLRRRRRILQPLGPAAAAVDFRRPVVESKTANAHAVIQFPRNRLLKRIERMAYLLAARHPIAIGPPLWRRIGQSPGQIERQHRRTPLRRSDRLRTLLQPHRQFFAVVSLRRIQRRCDRGERLRAGPVRIVSIRSARSPSDSSSAASAEATVVACSAARPTSTATESQAALSCFSGRCSFTSWSSFKHSA